MNVLVSWELIQLVFKGEPFEVLVKNGQTIEAGQDIATMNLKAIKSSNLDTTIMVLITNSNDKLEGLDVSEGPARTGDVIAHAYLKVEQKNTSNQKLSYDELATFIIKMLGAKIILTI